MSVTIGTIAGSAGLGSERQVIRTTSGDLWAFGYTGTNVLSTWVSQDNGATWSTGATHTLSNAHNSEGRNLAVAYKNIGGVDVVYVALPWTVPTSMAINGIRATIAGTTLTFHSVETAVASGTSDGDALLWAGTGLEFSSTNKLHLSNGWAGGGNGDVNADSSTVDAGTVEQMTPVTWSSHVIDSSVTKETRSAYVIDLGSGNAGLINDDGSAASTTTGLDWHKWNGSSWNTDNTNNKVTGGAITAIDKNNWGAVAISPSDIHVVYRNSAGTLIHRRYNGTAWGAGQTIPAQNNLGAGGIALSTDGNSVWLAVIDTDGPNTVRFIQWSSSVFNGLADAWGTWQVVEGSTATRTRLGCTRDTYNQHGLVYWTEGSSLVAAAFAASPPADPPGAATRDCVSPLASAAASASLPIVFSGACQPTAGDKIAVGFWASFSSTPTITSVKDNATVQNTYVAGPSSILANTQGAWGFWLDLPANATWSGNYTVTVTFSASVTESDGGAISYGNLTAGAPTATNNNSGSASPATSGAVNPSSGNSTYFAVVTDSTGSNPATFTWAAPFLKQTSQTNGSAQQAGSVGDALNSSGSQNASITIDAFPWQAVIMAWVNGLAPGALATRSLPRVPRGTPAVLRRELPYMSGQRLAYPAALTASAIALTSDATSSSASGGAQATASVAIALTGTIGSLGSFAATSASAVALSAPASSVGSQSATLAPAVALAGAVAAASSESAAPTVAVVLGGPVAAVGSQGATLTSAVALSGQAVSISSENATLASGAALSGSSAGIAAASGAAAAAVALLGQAQALSATSGTALEAVVVAGSVSSYVAATGNAQALTGTQLAGPVGAASRLSATLTVSIALVGSLPAACGSTSTIAVAAVLSGATSAVGALAGNLQGLSPVTGQSASATTASATLGAAVALAGGVSASSSSAATLGVAVGLAGPVGVTSSAIGVLSGVITAQLIAVTLVTRSLVLVTRTRDMAMSVLTRNPAALARTRNMAMNIITRSESSRTNTRG